MLYHSIRRNKVFRAFHYITLRDNRHTTESRGKFKDEKLSSYSYDRHDANYPP